MELFLKEIRLDGGTQPRETLDPDCVKRYQQDMLDGVQYDPIEVVYDGVHYWCWDGFHRCTAANLAQLSEMRCSTRTTGRPFVTPGWPWQWAIGAVFRSSATVRYSPLGGAAQFGRRGAGHNPVVRR